MPTVYITQVPHRRDQDTRAFVPAFDIAPAAEHGELVVMMPPQAPFYATDDLVRQLRFHLMKYDCDGGDSLIAMGDPSVIAAASALLGRMHGRFRLLKWDRNVGRYLPALINVT